eukprot:12880984-Prorocentrum_lima.AAC.1
MIGSKSVSVTDKEAVKGRGEAMNTWKGSIHEELHKFERREALKDATNIGEVNTSRNSVPA